VGSRTSLSRVVTLEQIAAAGVSADRVRRLVERGGLVNIRRGVYAPARLVSAATADEPAAYALRVAGVLAASGGHAVASHQSAAVLHGIDLIGRRPSDPVTVTRAPQGRGSRSWRDIQVHSAALPPHHLVTTSGIAVTSAARTVVDLARAQPFAAGVVAADSALRSKKATMAEINAVIADCVRWPGVKGARRVAAFCDGRSESALESIGRAVFHEYELPPPDLQVVVGCDDLGVVGRADYLWPEYATIAEADGAFKYAGQGRAVGQLNRDTRLRDAGFEVVHFTWPEITVTPWQVVDRIRAAFRRARRARVGSPGR
jgi:predicted transcriptional regulator of viral defense system